MEAKFGTTIKRALVSIDTMKILTEILEPQEAAPTISKALSIATAKNISRFPVNETHYRDLVHQFRQGANILNTGLWYTNLFVLEGEFLLTYDTHDLDECEDYIDLSHCKIEYKINEALYAP